LGLPSSGGTSVAAEVSDMTCAW